MDIPEYEEIMRLLAIAQRPRFDDISRHAFKILGHKLDRLGLRWEYFV